eukprot:scaffold13622_cov107-Isochrysis_galbana.AAC.3
MGVKGVSLGVKGLMVGVKGLDGVCEEVDFEGLILSGRDDRGRNRAFGADTVGFSHHPPGPNHPPDAAPSGIGTDAWLNPSFTLGRALVCSPLFAMRAPLSVVAFSSF